MMNKKPHRMQNYVTHAQQVTAFNNTTCWNREENNWDSTAGADERCTTCVSECIRWVTVKACWKCVIRNISGMLTAVEVCAGRNWCICMMRADRQMNSWDTEWMKKDVWWWRTKTYMDTNSPSAGGEDAEAEKGWMNVRGRKLSGSDGGNDPWIEC